ncbi:cyun92 [Cyclophragma undans nucleopolyhedrovirus]|uniref:Cyun92 n=1 Tax=Cyclophragma undans nucleopolyhedrovirus TaxID=1906244 RepID=A0A288Q7J6_9ABAC|nr:cyun92 [Cyclophragma undans nucleopolyhedrovirus]AOT85550.1 cyun92 [Cyclophragma undans nucleopolyhedrovirus]
MILPKCYYNLPYNGKRIFEKFYERSLQKYKSKQVARQLACCAVRKKYIYINNRWHARSDANKSDTTSTEEEESSSSLSSCSSSASKDEDEDER